MILDCNSKGIIKKIIKVYIYIYINKFIYISKFINIYIYTYK